MGENCLLRIHRAGTGSFSVNAVAAVRYADKPARQGGSFFPWLIDINKRQLEFHFVEAGEGVRLCKLAP